MDTEIMDLAETILLECENIMPDASSFELIDYYFFGNIPMSADKIKQLEKAILDIRISSQSY